MRLFVFERSYIKNYVGTTEPINPLMNVQNYLVLTKRTIHNCLSAPLHQHLHHHGVDYLQFSFRWMNNLLTREIPLHCTIRLWDTYLAESDRFASFQLYVCAAFLLRWRRHLLLQPDFQVSHCVNYFRTVLQYNCNVQSIFLNT